MLVVDYGYLALLYNPVGAYEKGLNKRISDGSKKYPFYGYRFGIAKNANVKVYVFQLLNLERTVILF